jgi:hypothetical protein
VKVATEKLQIRGVNSKKKPYTKKGVPIVEEKGTGEICLMMKLNGIDKN